MKTTELGPPPASAIGLAVYRTLLRLYPAAFRRAFGADMTEDFEEASLEAWMQDRWRGMLSLWFFTCADLMRTVPLQWLRSRTLIVSGLGLIFATSCAAAVGILDARVPYMIRSSSPERDGILLLILAATVVVVIAATIIFSQVFLRPALNGQARSRRV
jgi:hypothetical protein